MLKKSITFTDYNDPPVEHTSDFYFHLTEADLLELEFQGKGGKETLTEFLTSIVSENDLGGLIAQFKQLILAAYGIRREDGLGFDKSAEISKSFEGHPAFSVLFMELSTDDKKAADFVNGIMPKSLSEKIAAKNLNDKFAEKLKAGEPLSTAELAEALKDDSTESGV